MPPRAKFTREEIVQAALSLVRENGMEALTARSLGIRLASSARPIFTVFQSMEEVQQAVLNSAKKLYREYVGRGLEERLAFKGVGKQYILFSAEEPKLFQLLFMTEQAQIPDLENVLPLIDESYGQILSSIQEEYGVERGEAERLYHHLWIYTHGIAALCATGMCRFTGEEISKMMTEVFVSLLKNR
ncbi:MAG: WHG domain-containing protein [Lachnospiraceae bacterium]|nr:WHG domain-containing protein [Lachnospiraceae bacterium]